MIKFLTILVLIISTLLLLQSYQYNDYYQGWKDGWRNGYCYNRYGCIPPNPPIAPIPRIGENTYKHGYNRGFISGNNSN